MSLKELGNFDNIWYYRGVYQIESDELDSISFIMHFKVWA